MTPEMADGINGFFELFSGLMVLAHCRQVRKDKDVAGVSLPAVAFFTMWGVWNLFYYPSLEQHVSFIGGVFIVIANTTYLALLWKYRRTGAGA